MARRHTDLDGPGRPQPGPREERAVAVVAYLDEVAEHRIRSMWARLDTLGVPSVATTHGAGYRPHLTLAVLEGCDPAPLTRSLRRVLARAEGLPLTMTALGFFLTDCTPAYLAVAPSTRLLGLHEAVHAAVDQSRSWGYYQPGSWTPHCTLAMNVSSPSAVSEALGRNALPVRATIRTARVTRLPARTPPALARERLRTT